MFCSRMFLAQYEIIAKHRPYNALKPQRKEPQAPYQPPLFFFLISIYIRYDDDNCSLPISESFWLLSTTANTPFSCPGKIFMMQAPNISPQNHQPQKSSAREIISPQNHQPANFPDQPQFLNKNAT